MKSISPLSLLLLLAFILSTFPASTATPLSALISQLRAGGMVLYIRHAQTDHQQQDTPQLDLDDCSTQRNLSADGREYARQIGNFMRRHDIPIGEVIASPFCRTRDTAKLAFSNYRSESFLFFTVGMSRSERNQASQQLLRYMNQPPSAGRNNVVVAHTSNLKEAVNIWPEPEGVIHVFAPVPNDKPRHIGVIKPSDIAR